MDKEKVELDIQTLLAVGRALQSFLIQEQGKVNRNSISTNNLKQISRTYGIIDCINIVSSMIYSIDFNVE